MLRPVLVLALVFGSVHLHAEPELETRMPHTKAQSLSGHEVLLPSATAGHPAVIVIGFSYGSQKSMEQWDKEIGAQVTANSRVPLYNVAVIQDAPKLVRGIITHGMRAMVPQAGHDRFLTVIQGQDELKKAVKFSGRDEAYVVVIDGNGKIVYYTHGDPSVNAKKQIIDQIKEN